MSNQEEDKLTLNQLRKNILNYDLFLKTTQEGITSEELEKRSEEIKIDKEDVIDLLNLKGSDIKSEFVIGLDEGLKIGETILQRLSGPSSFRILKPKEKNFKNIVKPLIFLIGDIHRKINGFCDHCNCWDKENCCFYSFDSTFLQLLDRQTNINHPISIYLEEFRETMRKDKQKQLEFELKEKTEKYKKQNFEEQIKVGEPLLEFKINFSDCFRTLKEKINNTCPTNNIQWNYTDVRQAPSAIENIIFNYLYNKDKYQVVLNNIKVFLDHLFSLKTQKFVSGLLSSTKSKIRKQIIKAKLNLDNEIKNYIFPYFEYIWNKPFKLFNKKMEIIEAKLKSENLKILNIFYYNNKDISSIRILKESEIYFTLENINSIVVQLTSPFVELYSYYRMIKQMNNIIPEVSTIQSYPLIINILGEEHIQNYQYFLVNIKKEYEIYWVSEAEDKQDQCIIFKDLNLDLNQIFPKDIEYNEKNAHFNAIENFRKYLLGDIYENIISEIQNGEKNLDHLLQKRVNNINIIRPDFNLTLEKLKKLTEFDKLINEIEFDKIPSKLEFTTIKNLKYAMKSNNISLTKKILEQPQIEIDLSDFYLLLSKFLWDNYISPKGYTNFLELEDTFIPFNKFLEFKRREKEEIILEILELFYKKAGIKEYKKESLDYLNRNIIEFHISTEGFTFGSKIF